MAYIGNSPGTASQRIVTSFTATSGQTTFTPSSGYALGYCDVFLNGVKLVAGDDYTAANGIDVVLTTGASSGDSVEVVAYIPRGLTDGYTKSEADSKYLPLSGGTITSGATLNGGVVVNEDGADVDFRVEGNGDSHLLFADANENAVGVSTGGNALDDFKLEVVGNKAIGGVRVSDTFDANGYEIVTGTTNIITAYNRGTATWLPLRQRANQHEFYCDGVETLRLTPAGNLGLGVTPSAWWSGFDAIQLGANASAFLLGRTDSQPQAWIGTNVFYDGSNWRYISSAAASQYAQSLGEHIWFTAPSGTAGNSITLTQVLSVNLGTSLALQGATSQSGTGITFPATQNASANANTLDDYEEGTWTPTIVGSTNPVYGASIAQGKYTKIGSMVYVEFLIVITSVTSQGVGNIQISGMPFSSSSGSYQSNINFIYNDTWDVNMRNGYTAGTIIQPVPNSVTQSNIGWTAATLSTGYFSGAGWYIGA